MLALASYLIGAEEDYVRALQEAHRAQQEQGDAAAAARSAFWIGFHLANRGEMARATGWFGRAARLLEESGDCAERGYLLVPTAYRQLLTGGVAEAVRNAAEAVRIGQRFGDPDLLALALHLQGRALVRLGEVDKGLALLDEAMVAVATGELMPHVTGLIYCSVIGACREVWALRRAHEWTAALAEWCERQPDMVPYAGECRVYRAEILQLRGAWDDALREARRAVEHLANASEPRAAAFALYQRGEVQRLRGEFAAAEASYRESSRSGRQPQPGLALLRLAQGDVDSAASAIRRALAETADRAQRARLRPAPIEIMLDMDEIDEARRSCEELDTIAATCGGMLGTFVAQARGAIELASGDAAAALPHLRQAWSDWQAVEAPWESARVRVLIGRACRALDDEEFADLEIEAARAEFERLGALPDIAKLDARASRRTGTAERHGLTPREREVLALVATGKTNRSIADELYISEKTVARHVANIFGKLGLNSRAAATAYAYEHDLLQPPA
jgi:DNA-binding CsgD family transcriptional regulator